MKNLSIFLTIFFLLFSFTTASFAQRKTKVVTDIKVQNSIDDSIFKALKLRNIGPAFMSGRIADIAIHPEDDNLW
jgi:hypothetical protein